MPSDMTIVVTSETGYNRKCRKPKVRHIVEGQIDLPTYPLCGNGFGMFEPATNHSNLPPCRSCSNVIERRFKNLETVVAQFGTEIGEDDVTPVEPMKGQVWRRQARKLSKQRAVITKVLADSVDIRWQTDVNGIMIAPVLRDPRPTRVPLEQFVGEWKLTTR